TSARTLAEFQLEHRISDEVAKDYLFEFEQGDLELVLSYHADFDEGEQRLAKKVVTQAGGLIIARQGYGRPCPPQLRPWKCIAANHGVDTEGCICVYTDKSWMPSFHPDKDKE